MENRVPRRHRAARGRSLTTILTLGLLGALLSLLPPPLDAQYFGRNKVLWERFDFEVLETEHFRIHYYPESSPTAEYVARISERWYYRLSSAFDHEFEEKKPIIIYQDHADFQQTEITPGLIGEGTGGFTESIRNRVVLPLTGLNADNDHVIGHELVHAFQFDLLQQSRRQNGRAGQPRQVPLWMIEGLAEYLSQGRNDPATAVQMRDAVLHDLLPEREGLIRRQLSPYQYGQATWAYIAGEWGDQIVPEFFLEAMRTGVNGALESVLETTEEDFFENFHAALQSTYEPVMAGRQTGGDTAEILLDAESTGGSVSIAPSLSPDGRWIAFLSRRALAVDLYLADTETGTIERRLLSAEADSHYGNLSFLSTSVAWSPHGQRFAFEVFAEGERRLAIYNLESETVERRIDLPGVGGMRQPAWSPDGETLVFSANAHGGASDLYAMDLATDQLRRLTDDAYTAIQPSFSSDGQSLVFVTDRGPQTNLDTLQFGDLRLALLDLESLEVDVLSIFSRGKHIDPHFSPDGESVYFIGQPDGVPDVFRYYLADERVARLSALKTGVTGITDTSPALTVAAQSGMVAFSAQENGDLNVYRFASGRPEAAVDEDPAAGVVAGILPPVRPAAAESVVELYLASPEMGLPEAGRDYSTQGYESDVDLANIGPATIGIGATNQGAGATGAFSAYFSDMLNRHQLQTTIQGGSTRSGVIDFEDSLGLELTYLNQSRRFQWGARASRVPFLSTATFISQDEIDIDEMTVPAEVVERLFQIVKVTDFSLLGHYPFSLNNRIEAELGTTRIDFESEVERLVFPQGFAPFREEFGVPAPEALDLNFASVAFVRDTSRFGFVSPVRGSRFRLESEWTTGDLSFRTTTADYRRYFFMKPLTIAFRALHVGRRGDDAEDSRLPPLDVGHSALVRGYDVNSFGLSECTLAPGIQECPEVSRLFGSRIGVLNFELRLALLGTEDFGIFDVPVAPTELAFFIDAGAAWSSGESVEWTFERETTERVPVVSAGIAARSLLLGSLPIELYYAYPFQRPDADPEFGFRIRTAW